MNFNTTTHDAFRPNLWTPNAIVAAHTTYVLANLVNRTYEAGLTFGKAIEIPSVSSLTVQKKQTGVAYTPISVTETLTEIKIDQRAGVPLGFDNVLMIQANTNLVNTYATQAGIGLAKDIDSAIAAKYVDAPLSNVVGDGTTAGSIAMIIEAGKKLNQKNAPKNDRYLVIDSSFEADLRLQLVSFNYNIPGLTDVAVVNGFIGKIAGFDVYVSDNIVKTGVSGDVAHNMAFQRDAIGLVVQEGVTAKTQPDVLNDQELVVWQVLYGLKTLRPNFIVDVQTKSV